MLVYAKRLADYPSNPVALDTTTGNSNCNGQAETRGAGLILSSGHAKESIAESAALRVGGIEFRLTAYPLLRGKRQPLAGRAVAGQATAVNECLME